LQQLIVDQATENDDVAVVDEHRRQYRARIGDQIDGAGRARAQARLLLLNRQANAGSFVDLWRYLQTGADLFPVDGLERVDGAGGRAGIGELPGQKRDLLADPDFGFLIVQRDQRLIGDNVGVGVTA
jgi:hypothetical protein